ncbi:hypothetical protein C0991_002410 [Blastosporella zonata]|nr:hypothetical protein C0991_002410 [Blastosporella zonata]
MLLPLTLVVSLLASKFALATTTPRAYETHYYYAVEYIPEAYEGASLDDVLQSLGVEKVEMIGSLEHHWLVRAPKPLGSDLVRRGEHEEHDPVMEKFQSLRGRASSHLSARSEEGLHAREVVSSVRHLERQVLRQRAKRAPPAVRQPASVESVKQRFDFKDPAFPQQWHLVNDEYPEHMMNVAPVWEMGITGKGVIAAVVDDGLDFTSDDLSPNFDPVNSYDFNDHEALPYPKKDNDHHGTRCAGQIAAAKNDACGVGIAHEAKIAGIRILSKPISDVDEAVALNYGYQNVSVYSCSWGPPDNGKAMGSPSYLIKKSVVNGINNGRGGKGSIFVFASGNGGGHEDQCNYDGYTNSIYSVTVSALDYTGQHPYYSEACAANMVTAYSSGSGNHIVTTDKGKNECATNHGGTSAAAPNAAGVFTLAVQARPELTWRDIQYLSIETAKMVNPKDPDWETTASGRKFSYKYGYGVLDAYKFVTAAQKWDLVKPQAWFDSPVVQLADGKMDVSKEYSGGTPIGPGGVTSKITITKEMLKENNFESLEHINVQVWIDHTRRGDVEVEVISPKGIKSILGKKRSGDDSKNGFPGWVFMSIKHWGEDPLGEWTIKVSDQNSADEEGKFLGWKMKFWGTTIDPLKAEKFEVPVVDNVLPPVDIPYRPVIDVPSVTKEHIKPTAFLHVESAAPTATSASASASTSHMPSQSSAANAKLKYSDLLVEVSHIVCSHKIFAGCLIGGSLLSMLVVGIFFRIRQNRMRNYSTLHDGTDSVSGVSGGYGAEPAGLVPSAGLHPQDRMSVGLGFHSSFLHDDALSTAGTVRTPRYRDEPEVPPKSIFLMKLPWTLVLALLQHSVLAFIPAKRSYTTHNYYVLEHDPLAGASLTEIAAILGVEVVEQAGQLMNMWLVRAPKPDLTSRSNDPDPDPVLHIFNTLRRSVEAAENVHWASRSEDAVRARAVVSSTRYLSRQTLRRRIKRAPPPLQPSSEGVASHFGIADPLFSKQWHLVNNDYPEHMMNVTPVWEMGFTGKGVISSLVDDGLDYTSDDLKDNFDADDSYDFNDHEPLPTPKKFDDHHGTRCAGQIAAVKNNACGIGIAYESKVAGVRILSGPISDVDEAAALNYGFHNVSIYSCSWGPPDNGQAMEGPGYLIDKAVVNGINNGRGGKGSIFVFASGNGAASGDQCNFDGYTNSIYSVTVSAVDYKGLHPYYSEPCAANMVVAYSSGSGKHIVRCLQIYTDSFAKQHFQVTSDKGKNACTQSHGGTSAAAPNAVGVFALALEARPDLSWRDIQHLCVETARLINPEDPDWEATANGRLYSYKYGFGVLDAGRYVTAAQSWQLVKPQAWFETPAVQLNNGTMDTEENYSGGQFITEGGITSTITITQEMLQENNFEALEHINVKVWIDHRTRGDVEVELTSPKGFKSVLAKRRVGDRATTGFPGWRFMSVKHWGEDPVGNWTIKVSDQETPETSNGAFLGWNMKFWGSTIDPAKALTFEVPLVDNVLPVHIVPPVFPTPTITSTKVLSKPTAHLPDDHGTAPGENTNPAFSSALPGPTSTPVPSADVGWFPSLSNLVASQKWFFGAIGAVALFAIGMGVFFWRRRKARLAHYNALPAGDDLSMSALATGRRSTLPTGNRPTRELYDAFGELSDDDEDADEGAALRGNQPHERVDRLGFHSGFLDDEPSTAGGAPTPKYRDEPEREPERRDSASRPSSPDGSGGSWEHAS